MNLDEAERQFDQLEALTSVPFKDRDALISTLEIGKWPGDESLEKTVREGGRRAVDKAIAARTPLVEQVKKAREKEAELHPFPKLEHAYLTAKEWLTPGSEQPEAPSVFGPVSSDAPEGSVRGYAEIGDDLDVSPAAIDERSRQLSDSLYRTPALGSAIKQGIPDNPLAGLDSAQQTYQANRLKDAQQRSPIKKHIIEPFQELGKGLVYRGPVAFFDWLDRKSAQAAKAAGVTRKGKSIYTHIADLARSQAEEKPIDPTWVTEFMSNLGQVPTRDIPKVAAFVHSLGPVLGFGALGLVDGAEKGTKEALIEGAKGMLLGGAFKGMQGLGMGQRAVAGGALFGGQAVAEGETDPGTVAGAALTGAILGVPGPVKGDTFRQRLSGYQADATRPAGGNVFENLGVDPDTATISDVRKAFVRRAGALKEATVSAKTDAQRLKATKQYQRLVKDFREAEVVLGKTRPVALAEPAVPEELQPSGPQKALPPGLEPTLIPGPPTAGEVRGGVIYEGGQIEPNPDRFEPVNPLVPGRLYGEPTNRRPRPTPFKTGADRVSEQMVPPALRADVEGTEAAAKIPSQLKVTVGPEGLLKKPTNPLIQSPRSSLPIEQSMDLQLRAEKAQADIEIAGQERGGRTYLEQTGKGGTPEVVGFKSATADWYKELTTGPRPLKRPQIETAIQKIIQDQGVDTGTAVERVKEALLRDREFAKTPWGEDADMIMRGEWPSWIEKPAQGRAVQPDVAGTEMPDQLRPSPPTPMPQPMTGVDQAAHGAASSPRNALMEPTPAQKEAGNYKKGHVTIAGMDIVIENPEGSTRSGTDASGKPWSVTMKSHYGYIKGTVGKDKDHLDVFIKSRTSEGEQGPVYIVDQNKPGTKTFDEHKIILGARSIDEAKQLYLENYTKDWQGLGAITELSMPDFKAWLQSGETKKPFARKENTWIRETTQSISETKALKSETTPAASETITPPVDSTKTERLTELGAAIPGQEAVAQQKRVKPSVPRIPVSPITGGTPKPLTDILVNLSTGTGQKLTQAKMPRGAGGVYYPGSTATTIRYSGDLDTTAHELAHALDDRFGIMKQWENDPTSPFDAELQPFAAHGSIQQSGPRSTPKYVRAEGVAEWVRAWVVNPDAAVKAAPNFSQHVLSKLSPDVMTALKQFSDDVRTHAGGTAHQKIMANVEWEVPKSSMLDWLTGGKAKGGPGFKLTWADTAQAEMVDRLHAFDKAIEYARKQRGMGEKPLPKDDPQVLIRLYAGRHAKMDKIFEKGMVNTQGRHVTKGGLQWLVDPLDPKHMDAEMQEAVSYMIAERTIEKIQRDVDAQTQYIKGLKLTPLEEAKQIAKAEAAIRRRKVSGAGAGLEKDIEVAEQRIAEMKKSDPAKLARIEEAAKRYREWADANLKYLLDRGRITQDQYDWIKENNQYYVSMQRILEVSPGEDLAVSIPKGKGGGKIGSPMQPIHEFHGSTREIRNPYTTLMEATYRAVSEGDRNYIMSLFRDLLTNRRGMYGEDRADLASVGRLARAGEKHTIPIYNQGEREIWQFHPDLYKALKGVDDLAMQLPGFLEVLTYPAKIMRVGVTQAPPFALRNIIRDAFQRTVVSNNGSKPWDSLKKYSQAEMDQFALAGGDQAGYYYRDDRSYQKAMKQALRKLTGQQNVVVAPLANLVNGYSAVIEGAERQGRMAEYRRVFKKAKNELGYDDYNASLYAASEARGLLDFAVAGNTMRVVNRFIPFTNAAIQGLRVAAERAKAAPMRTALLWFAYVATPTLFTYMWNHVHGDIEEYRQLPAYQRDLFWNFKVGPDLWLTIPKPFELGAMATTIERMTDKAMGNEQALEGHWKSLANSLLPVDESALFGPLQSVGSAIANYDFFRDRHIVPPHEEKLDLDLRTTHRASRLGQILQEAVGVDARKIDFMVHNQLGYFGRYLTSASDIGRTDRQGFGPTSTGVLRGDPVETALDVKWLHEKAAERGATGTTEWRRFADLKKRYHKAEGAEAREQLGQEVRRAAKRLREQWERKPPRSNAEERAKKKRGADAPSDPIMNFFRPTG